MKSQTGHARTLPRGVVLEQLSRLFDAGGHLWLMVQKTCCLFVDATGRADERTNERLNRRCDQ